MPEKNSQYILILGGGENQLPFIKKAKELGYKTIVFDVLEHHDASIIADMFFRISIFLYDDIIKKIDELDIKIMAVVARVSRYQGLISAYKIAQKYHTIFLSLAWLKISFDKKLLYDFCLENKIDVPETQLVSSKKQLVDITYNNEKKYILKPAVTEIGKKNIFKISSKLYLTNNFGLTQDVSGNKQVLIQEFVEGIDVSYMVAVENGAYNIIATWDELIGFDQKERVKAIGLVAPSIVKNSVTIDNKICKYLKMFCQYFKTDKYIVVFSFRVSKDEQVSLIEIHSDLSGDLITEKLLPAANQSFDFFYLCLNFLLNKSTKLKYDFKNTLLLYGKNNYQLFNFNHRKEILTKLHENSFIDREQINQYSYFIKN